MELLSHLPILGRIDFGDIHSLSYFSRQLVELRLKRMAVTALSYTEYTEGE